MVDYAVCLSLLMYAVLWVALRCCG